VYLVVITAYRACKCVSIQAVCSFIANILINIHVLPIKHHLRPPNAVNPLFDNPYPHTRTCVGPYNVAKVS
jgi:hypothetical protein